MSEYAHTSNGAAISLVDFPSQAVPPQTREPVALTLTATRNIPGRLVFTPQAPGGFQLGERPQPSFGIYTLERDEAPPPGDRTHYQIQSTSYAFQGTLGDPAAVVQESHTWELRSAAEVYQRRISELGVIYNEVRNQGVEVTLPSNGVWAMRTSVDATDYYTVNSQTTLPGATLFADRDVFGVRMQWAVSDLPTILTQVGLHLAVTIGVRDDHGDALDALLAADDAAGLSAYDLTRNWPAAPAGVTTRTTRTVEIDTFSRALSHPRIQGTPGGVGQDLQYVYRFLLRNYAIRDDLQALFQQWLAEHPGA